VAIGCFGGAWREHVILDAGLGGHEAVVAVFDGDGRPDVCSKLWSPRKDNASGTDQCLRGPTRATSGEVMV